MAAIKTRALVLRHRNFSESSLIVTLLGRDCGRLDVLAKGCRREKSPLFGHLDLYQCEDVLVFERSGAGLDLLIEASFADEQAGLRFYPPAFAAAGMLAELAADATLPGEPQVGLYDVLADSFRMLSSLGEPAAKAGLAEPSRFTDAEKKVLVAKTVHLAMMDMLGWLGFGLELKRCVLCGRLPDKKEGKSLSRRHGGLVCASCRPRAGQTVPVGDTALAAFRERDGDGREREARVSPAERIRWLRFLADYARAMVERPLRSATVFFQLMRE